MFKVYNQKRVVVAMSGGIDSSVAAALLKRAGFDLIGVFMKFWVEPEKNGLVGTWNRCCSPEAEKRARAVASFLNIPFYIYRFEKEFKKRIVDYFLKEYKANKTPNPCVVCNKEIKFGLLLEKALKLNTDYIATGHYARLRQEILNPKSGHSPFPMSWVGQPRSFVKRRGCGEILNYRYKLLKAKDKNKDQSYFLWQLNQKQLKHILFPVGNYTKEQVKNLAKKFNLPVLGIPESQEICFIKTTVNDFLARHLKSKPGPILTAEYPEGPQTKTWSGAYGVGKKIGQHRGLPFYTIGQRKGIEIPGGPYYVVTKNLKRNALIVTPFFNDKNLYKKTLIAKNVNWISGKEPQLPIKIKAQIRYRHKAISATITKKLKSKTYELIFDSPQRAITPGQSVVLYQKSICLGGGRII